MKVKKLSAFMRGVAALMAVLLVLSVIGTGIAETYRSQLDSALGTNSWVLEIWVRVSLRSCEK